MTTSKLNAALLFLVANAALAGDAYTCKQFIADSPQKQLQEASVVNFVSDFNKLSKTNDKGGMALLSLYGYCYNKQNTEISAIDARSVFAAIDKTNEKKDGQVSYNFTNGDSYLGYVKNGKYTNGTYTYANGNKYIGEFSQNMASGKGVMSFANGDRYEGLFKNNLRNGFGTYKFADGRVYVGEYKDDLYNGNGTYTQKNGEKYIGEFKNGTYNGSGTYTYADGRVNAGQWKEGAFLDKTNNQDSAENKKDEMLACLQGVVKKVVDNCKAASCREDTLVGQIKLVQQAQCGYSAINTNEQRPSYTTTPQAPVFTNCTSRRNLSGDVTLNCMQY